MRSLIVLLTLALTVSAQPGESTLNGTVTSYDAAKSIEIDSKGTSHKFDLNDGDIQYSISPEVATGMYVTVTIRIDENKHKNITIVPAPKPKPGVDQG